MCGIVGYIGKSEAWPVLLDGLKRLEYRGYDSAGISTVGVEGLRRVRASGRIRELEAKGETFAGTVGIAHTRWATHGPPVERNAHPHADCSGKVMVVHNGIIENHLELRRELEAKGHVFVSDTDTEVLAHSIEEVMKGGAVGLEQAMREALRGVRGTFGIAVIAASEPDRMVVARLGSPIVLGIGKDETVVASDASAIVGRTKDVVYLDDGEMAVLERDGYRVSSLDARPIEKTVVALDWTTEEAEKGGYPHFMLKEMMEEPETLRNTLRGRIDAEAGEARMGGLRDVADRLREMDRLVIVACGSAYYAGLVGEFMLEELAGIPVEVELGSEFRYRSPVIDRHTAVIAVSQSGETADTLAAVREAKRKGALTLGIVNAVGSTIARETDAGVYNHAGPEIGVASTKAFVSQLAVFALLALFLGRQRRMSLAEGQVLARELTRLPDLVARTLEIANRCGEVARSLENAKGAFYLGRKYCAPIALEGALKLKEVSYIHAEGYPAGEMKHGPIALVDAEFPSVVLCLKDSVYEKTRSNIQELKARGGPIIAIASEGDDGLDGLADSIVYVPRTSEALSPILAVIPLQMIAYNTAVRKGYDPDKPRNLAKSVTVE